MLLVAANQLGLATAFAGWLLSLVAGGWIAHGRLRELDAIAAWIEAIPREQAQAAPSDGESLLAGRLLRPVSELGRELRRQSGQMATQRRMLRSTIEALPDPIMLVDGDMTGVQANAAANRSFAAPAPPVPLARVLRDPGVLAAVSAALSGNAASNVSFSPTHDRDKQFSSRIEPVDLGDGRRGVLMAMREQTEQVMIERMRSDFVANASHEIRTPLASIQGLIETLRGAAKHDPKARDVPRDHGRRRPPGCRVSWTTCCRSRASSSLLCNLHARFVTPVRPCATPWTGCRRRPSKGVVTLAVEVPDRLPAMLGDADQLHQLSST